MKISNARNKRNDIYCTKQKYNDNKVIVSNNRQSIKKKLNVER